MPKLTLKQSPTFDAYVAIPVPGADAVRVLFTFRNRKRELFEKWLKSLGDKSKDEAVLDMAEGWELEDDFNPENVTELLSNYLGAFDAIFNAYLEEITQVKVKN